VNTIIAICLWIAYGATSGFVAFVIGFLAMVFTIRATINWVGFTIGALSALFGRRS
jgi:hypothetical protein